MAMRLGALQCACLGQQCRCPCGTLVAAEQACVQGYPIALWNPLLGQRGGVAAGLLTAQGLSGASVKPFRSTLRIACLQTALAKPQVWLHLLIHLSVDEQ